MAANYLLTPKPNLRMNIKCEKEEIYVGAVPLRASKGPAQLLMSTAYSLNLWDAQHYLVLIKSGKPSSTSQVTMYDFQPKDPEDLNTAFAVLSGRAVPGTLYSVSGVVLTRKLKRLPRTKCWYVGSANVGAVDAAARFSRSWETDLLVGRHDCCDYTNGLVELLTGEKSVLERLRRTR